MSIYATNYTVNEETGEVKLIKRLNKTRVNRSTYNRRSKGWNKSGKTARTWYNELIRQERRKNKVY